MSKSIASVFACAVIGWSSIAHASNEFVNLGIGTFPTAISENGIVAGVRIGGNNTIFRYTHTEGVINLGSPFNQNNVAVRGVNNSGTIVGQASGSLVVANNGAFKYSPATGFSTIFTDRPSSDAFGISNRGEICGTDVSTAFRTTLTEGTILFGASTEAATSINESGAVTGYGGNNFDRAFVADPNGVVQYLTVPGASRSYGRAINNQGQILIQSLNNGLSANAAFIYTPGQGYSVLAGTGSNLHQVTDMNNNGWVVGSMNDRGVLWLPNAPTPLDLSNYVQQNFGITLDIFRVSAINDAGQMVGLAYDSQFNAQGFVLTIPSPTGALVLGAGTLPLMPRRRRSKLSI